MAPVSDHTKGRYASTYSCRPDITRLRNTNTCPYNEVRILPSRHRLLISLDALLQRQASLEILHDVVRRDRAAVDVRGPEVGLERLVVCVAALRGLPGGVDEYLLHLVGVARLRREQEARAACNGIGARGQKGTNLGAGSNTTSGNDRGLGESSADGGDEVEDRG